MHLEASTRDGVFAETTRTMHVVTAEHGLHSKAKAGKTRAPAMLRTSTRYAATQHTPKLWRARAPLARLARPFGAR